MAGPEWPGHDCSDDDTDTGDASDGDSPRRRAGCTRREGPVIEPDGGRGEASADPPVVLVAEDERGLADLFEAWLSESYEVRVAYDGAEAIERYDSDVDVVLLDRHMPRNSGDEVLSHVREHDPDCGVAMVTAVEPDFDVVDLPFDEYVLKPVDRDELLSTVESLRRRRTYDRGLRRHYRLTETLTLLESHKDEATLAASDEYQSLVAELEALDRELSSTVEELTAEDVGAVLRAESSER
jgi:DNA-binding response OmpR family regulator